MKHTIIVGDCLEALRAMPSDSVHCWVTSPPYLWLRDYGTAMWHGGDTGCDHLGAPKRAQAGFNERWSGKAPATTDKQGELRAPFIGSCGKCGAIREDKQIGLEASLDEYLRIIVEVFREARRVLHPSGSVWINLGDTFAGSGRGPTGKSGIGDQTKRQGFDSHRPVVPTGMKPKDLMGLPWMVAFALRADGWWLRSEVIWEKPNPMPTSIKDRPNQSHEQIFLLTKKRRYYYDWWGIRERGPVNRQLLLWDGETARHAPPSSRNKRSVWKVSPRHYRDATEHFATFPPELIVPCVQASTSDFGACAGCGTPWERVLRPSDGYARLLGNDWGGSGSYDLDQAEGRGRFQLADGSISNTRRTKRKAPTVSADYESAGWRPGCKCGDAVTPCVVGDMFMGSGTTAIVAARMRRASIGCELNPRYATVAIKRVTADGHAGAQAVTLDEYQRSLFPDSMQEVQA